jgi:nicotinamide mononucleotide transporter
MHELSELFLNSLYEVSWLEITAVIFGLLSVWYSKKVNILVFPTGIVSVLIYVYICYIAGIYADMGINVVYFFMSIYGWYRWTHPRKDNQIPRVAFSTRKQNIAAVILTVAAFVLLVFVLGEYTDSNVVYLDSFTTAIFITGMWLMAIKKVENWLYWIIGDIVSVPLYLHKGLAFTSVQFFVFLLIAIAGYLAWRKAALNETADSHNRT